MIHKPEDIRLLVIHFKKGDHKAFQTLFTIFKDKLYHFVFQYVKSEHLAKEVVQEVFVKLWLNREELNHRKNFTSFLFVMARNQVYDHLRKLARRDALKKEYAIHRHKTHQKTADDIQFREYAQFLEALIEKLPKQKRLIYRLSRYEGKTNNEIADLLGISPKTVKNQLWEVVKIIKERIQTFIE